MRDARWRQRRWHPVHRSCSMSDMLQRRQNQRQSSHTHVAMILYLAKDTIPCGSVGHCQSSYPSSEPSHRTRIRYRSCSGVPRQHKLHGANKARRTGIWEITAHQHSSLRAERESDTERSLAHTLGHLIVWNRIVHCRFVCAAASIWWLLANSWRQIIFIKQITVDAIYSCDKSRKRSKRTQTSSSNLVDRSLRRQHILWIYYRGLRKHHYKHFYHATTRIHAFVEGYLRLTRFTSGLDHRNIQDQVFQLYSWSGIRLYPLKAEMEPLSP